ncbi:hypothetical protein MYCTH_2297476 [Thermothelomyces thermophilus ATCC 42464]|uniref:Uncharacterized protein n=1 Tax=Thermothelomyces thermophilus (strain ATCC 42464 / BCRC 31852 / DSM 1799) TaxID=573729 RepID=G2Q5Z2_THET4|nr:uncharacterized protein MYCTH_2297476 [Thermothelomyces thermophilus ATCC 42464]AEO54669.1 hypothetical protein MYCTH_2297476 [Thermothelomyces thermophilus ATCC 42464]
MGSKRDHDAVAADDSEPSQSSSKRRREQQSLRPKQVEGKPDPTYGQRAAFPGLDDDDSAQISDDDLEFEENSDALAYLRAVRQEASGVPHVLVAPKVGPQLPPHLQGDDEVDRSIYANGVGDSRGYYHDGAYTAAPDPDPSVDSSDEEGEVLSATEADRVAARKAALRKAYFASLTRQFLALRALLHRTPPPALVAALPRDHGTEVGSFGANSWTFRVWTRRIRHTDPLPVQIAALNRQSVLKLLRVILGGKFIRRGYELRERTSRWIWALLARLPDRGELDYAEVGWVRELGKRAVLMMMSIAQMEALKEEVDGDLEGTIEGDEDDDDDGDKDDDNGGEGFIGDMVVDEDGESGLAGPLPTESKARANVATNKVEENKDGEVEMNIDDGEVTDDDQPTTAGNEDLEADIAAAKARLLARLEEGSPEVQQDEELPTPADADAGQHQRGGDGENKAAVSEGTDPQVNLRATLNMILTVAGEFYGQRDLLEFRDPFPAV